MPGAAEGRARRSPEDVGALLAFGRRLGAIRDRDVLEVQAAAELHRLLAGTVVCVTPVDPGGDESGEDDGGPPLVVGAAHGTRVAQLPGLRLAPGAGVGGRAAACGRLVAVDDYAREIEVTELVELMAGAEGIGGAAAVPLRCDGRVLGIVFAGRRERGAPGDRELDLLCDVADDLARMLSAADQARRHVERVRNEERRRLAGELHDDLAPLLFGIGVAAGRARDRLGAVAAADELEHIEALAGSATAAIRAALRRLAPAAPGGSLPLALAATVDRFRERTQIPVELVDLGAGHPVGRDVSVVVAACVSEALTNVSRHAPGAAAVVTLAVDEDAVEVTVQDDGPGPPPGSGPPFAAPPGTGERFGLAALAERLVPFDGALDVGVNEDGGVTVALRIPRTGGTGR